MTRLTPLAQMHLALTLACTGALALIATTYGARAEPHPDASRIVGVGGSVTEIVVALGEEDRLVARDTTSTFPERIEALPDVGYIRRLSPEGVLSVDPDLILAEAGSGPPEAVDVLKAAAIPFEEMPDATDGPGVIAKIRAVAEVLGVAEKGDILVAQVEAELAEAARAAASVETPKKALFILSLQGGRVLAAGTGTAAAGILELAGAENAVTGFEGYKPMTDEAVLTAAPDVIVMMEGRSDHGAGDGGIFSHPALAATPAASGERLVTMDGLLLLGFGPRSGTAAQMLHDAIYGED